jgi:hypothetical protein
LLSAVLAAIVALALIIGGLWALGQNPGGILDSLCPPDIVTCPEPETTGSIIGDIFAGILTAIVCGFVLGDVAGSELWDWLVHHCFLWPPPLWCGPASPTRRDNSAGF